MRGYRSATGSGYSASNNQNENKIPGDTANEPS